MKKTKLVYLAVLVAIMVSIVAPTAALAGGWHTNIEITDIYPGRQPYGQFWFRITNHGPGNMVNVQVRVFCIAPKFDKNVGLWAVGESRFITQMVTLQPGQTQAFPTGISLDSTVFSYDVTCDIAQGHHWEDGGPNVYTEFVP